MQTFFPSVALLVLLDVARAQQPVNPRSGRQQQANPLSGPVLTNPVGTPAVGNSTNSGPVRSDSGQDAASCGDHMFVSITWLGAPPAARKAYEKANREMGKRKPDPARAATHLEAAVTLYPSFAAAWFFLGGIRLILNDAENARLAFERALAADPRFPYAYVPLAALELRAGHHAEAARLADSVLKLDDRLMEAHYFRALANSMLRRYDNARQSIQTILDRGNGPQYPGVHAMLAVILVADGDRRAAAIDVSHFLELDPDSPGAAAAREYLDQWRAAEKASAKR